MILDPTLTAAYIVIATALAISPGPDVVFVVANGMRYRVKGAVASALGIGSGSLVHATLACLGVSAIIVASPLAFKLLKYAGAIYLAYLGFQALRASWNFSNNLSINDVTTEVSARDIFKRGVITNILNPKMVVFYLALLPQFVSLELGHVGLQIFLLGCIHNVIGTLFLIGIGLAAGKASAWLLTTHLGKWLDAVAGVFFLALAIRLSVTGDADS